MRQGSSARPALELKPCRARLHFFRAIRLLGLEAPGKVLFGAVLRGGRLAFDLGATLEERNSVFFAGVVLAAPFAAAFFFLGTAFATVFLRDEPAFLNPAVLAAVTLRLRMGALTGLPFLAGPFFLLTALLVATGGGFAAGRVAAMGRGGLVLGSLCIK